MQRVSLIALAVLILMTILVFSLAWGFPNWLKNFEHFMTQVIFRENSNESPVKREFSNIKQDLYGGGFGNAAQRARTLADLRDQKDSVFFDARNVSDTSMFKSTSEKESRAKAVRAMIETYQLATTPADRSRALLRIVSSMHSAHESHAFNEVFKDDAFKKFLVPGDSMKSISNIADFAYSIKPYSHLADYIARWDMEQIDKLYDQKRDPTVDKRLQSHVDAVLKQISVAEDLFKKESANPSKSPTAVARESIHYFWRGDMYGRLALVDARFLPEAESALNKVLAEYEEKRNPDGSPIVLLSELSASAHRVMARYLYLVGGQARLAEARQHGAEAVKILEAYPEGSRNFYVVVEMIREMQDTHNTQMEDNLAGDHTIVHETMLKRFTAVADASPEFRALLERKGAKI